MKRRDFITKSAGTLAAASLGTGTTIARNVQPATALPTRLEGEFETYSLQHRVRSGICHGGIGTGGIELRKDGQFYNWSIFNNTPRGYGAPAEVAGHPIHLEAGESLEIYIK